MHLFPLAAEETHAGTDEGLAQVVGDDPLDRAAAQHFELEGAAIAGAVGVAIVVAGDRHVAVAGKLEANLAF